MLLCYEQGITLLIRVPLDQVLTALFCTFKATDISAYLWNEISGFKHLSFFLHTYIAANRYQDTNKRIESNIICFRLL